MQEELPPSQVRSFGQRNCLHIGSHSKYKDCYIDMIALVQKLDGKVPVFSVDGRFVSQDCRHLTKAGAQMYAELIDWERMIEKVIK